MVKKVGDKTCQSDFDKRLSVFGSYLHTDILEYFNIKE